MRRMPSLCSTQDDANTTLVAVFNANMACCRVATAAHAMNLLLTSERVLVDLNIALDCLAAAAAKKKTDDDKPALESKAEAADGAAAAGDAKAEAGGSTAATAADAKGGGGSHSPDAESKAAESKAAEHMGDAKAMVGGAAAELATKPGTWAVNIILRQWCPELDGSFEFRCFVYKGALPPPSSGPCPHLFVCHCCEPRHARGDFPVQSPRGVPAPEAAAQGTHGTLRRFLRDARS